MSMETIEHVLMPDEVAQAATEANRRFDIMQEADAKLQRWVDGPHFIDLHFDFYRKKANFDRMVGFVGHALERNGLLPPEIIE